MFKRDLVDILMLHNSPFENLLTTTANEGDVA